MTGERRRFRSVFGWATVAAVVGCLSCYIFVADIHQRTLKAALADTLKSIKALKVELVDSESARRSASVVCNRWNDETDSMAEMLRQCKSREDFVVREGPRIAWSELSGTSDTAKKIGMYLPAGRHRLRYVVLDSGRLRGIETYQFLQGDPRELAGIVSVELGPEAEVYEFEYKVGDDGFPRISVIGRDNTGIHEETVPLMVRPGKKVFAKLSKDAFTFPSEFHPNDKERPYFLKPESPPLIEFGILDVAVRSTGGAAMLRLWIESDARPCMPAIYVAAKYDKVTSLRYRHDNPSPVQRVSDPATEFNRLFEPYDGASCFRFREGIFKSNNVDSQKHSL